MSAHRRQATRPASPAARSTASTSRGATPRLAAEGKCRYCQAPASGRLCEDCERRAARSGRVVYFLRAFVGRQAMIKVGSTAKLRRRVVELQTASPVRLHVLAAVPGGEPKERELHRLLAPFRSHGEWYRGEPEVMEVVAKAKRRGKG